MYRQLLVSVSCLGLLGIIGCDKGPSTSDVTGVILLDDKPLELIHVEFWPLGEGIRSFGKTDENGKFTLELDDRSKMGAVVGRHKVLLRDTWPLKDNVMTASGEWIDNSKGKKSRISTKYYEVTNSPLEYEVKSTNDNHFEIKVEPRR